MTNTKDYSLGSRDMDVINLKPKKRSQNSPKMD